MARVFTTSFEFNHQRYNAIVTIITSNQQLNFTVKLLDTDLHHLFPNGEIAYTGADGFEALEVINNTVAQSLMRKVGAAINQHLTTTE
jgi:hypothetical protein